ncbi:cytochrome b5 [Lecanosticta acicola]|uniref:Cytochrome b5 n=1 Tax=Lecanosticta acicola TaxID=111012 RepID=A0AAI8YTU3_9PEZI|nr:cytochrome b5 [Lecanosticta acicola]
MCAALGDPTDEDIDRTHHMVTFDGQMRGWNAQKCLENQSVAHLVQQQSHAINGPNFITALNRIEGVARQRSLARIAIARKVGGLVFPYKAHDELVEDWIDEHAKEVMRDEDYGRSDTVGGLVTRICAILNPALFEWIQVPPFVLDHFACLQPPASSIGARLRSITRSKPRGTKMTSGPSETHECHAYFWARSAQVCDLLSKYAAESCKAEDEGPRDPRQLPLFVTFSDKQRDTSASDMAKDSETPHKPDSPGADASKKDDHQQSTGITLLDGLRILVGLLLLNVLLSYFITGDSFFWGHRAWWTRPNALIAKLRKPVILTDSQLLEFAGQDDSKPIYLALNGTIYDVTAGRRIYGPGGPYNVFAGRDASRAYITGCFAEDNVPDVRGIEWTFIPQDVPRFEETPDSELSEMRKYYRYEMAENALEEVDKGLEHWAKMFRGEKGKDYFEVGYVKREAGWLEKMPSRTLCANAEKKRPKSKFDEKEKYEKGARAFRRARKARKQKGGETVKHDQL